MHARAIVSEVELERGLEIRRIVFIEEQGVAKDLELDGLEADCVHFLVWPGDEAQVEAAVGTARLWIDSEGRAKAQRVAVLAAARGSGAGRALMRAVEAQAAAGGHASLHLGAQVSAMPFYERLGYRPYGDAFDDAGIPHRMMRLDLDPVADAAAASLAQTRSRQRDCGADSDS